MSEVFLLEAAKPIPVPEVIEQLEALLAEAKLGNLRGYAMLTNHPATVGASYGGEWDAANAVFAAECWKNRYLNQAQGF